MNQRQLCAEESLVISVGPPRLLFVSPALPVHDLPAACAPQPGLSSAHTTHVCPVQGLAEHRATAHCPHCTGSLSLTHCAQHAPLWTTTHTGLGRAATQAGTRADGQVQGQATQHTCQKRETRKATLTLSPSKLAPWSIPYLVH